MYFKVGLFKRIVRLISDKIQEGESVTIVCNKGVSRSASIALLYLAATRQINRENFKSAKEDFLKFYPPYNPGRGISAFLNHYWRISFQINNMSHTRVKTTYSVQGAYGSTDTEELYCDHNHSCDCVTFKDKDGDVVSMAFAIGNQEMTYGMLCNDCGFHLKIWHGELKDKVEYYGLGPWEVKI